MEVNELPIYDMSDNETGCCPRFNPEPWIDQELHFKDKQFVKVNTHSLFHIPLDMGHVFKKTFEAIQKSQAEDKGFICLSHDPTMFTGEHFFSVSHEVPGLDNVKLSGDYLTRVFEGPNQDVANWNKEMKQYVESRNKTMKENYFYYTTCPKCSKYYGNNYVVAVAEYTE